MQLRNQKNNLTMNFSIIRSTVTLVMILGLLVSCANEAELTTKSGLKVNMIRKGGDTPAIKGGVATLNLRIVTENGGLLFDSEKRGGAVPVKMTEEDKGLLDEVVDVLNIGDSVIFEFPAEDLFEKTYQMNLPDTIKRGTLLKFNMSMENTFTETAYEAIMEEKRDAQLEKWKLAGAEQLKEDILAIDKRLDEEGKDYIKLNSGVRIILTKEGEGKKPEIGNHLNVHYVGRYFSTGEIFDESDKEMEPFDFALGSGVIEGWSRAFAELKEGSSATIYIPSGLAYGPNDFQNIPANSILIFDVDFVRIEK